MLFRSFRFRIACLSVLLAGSTLAAFSVASWLLIYEAKVKRLDGEIRNQLLRSLSPAQASRGDWQNYYQTLPAIFSAPSQTEIAFLVTTSNGSTLFRSSNWSPAQLSKLKFPAVSALPDPLPNERYPLPEPGRPGFPPPPNGQPPQFPPQTFPDYRPEDRQNQRPFPPIERQEAPKSRLTTHHSQLDAWRTGTAASPSLRIALSVNLQVIDEEMRMIRNGFLITIPAAMLLMAIGAWILSGSALAPLKEVTLTIRRVTAKGLDQRIKSNAADVEFVELLQVFNQMMERLDRSFKQASRFSADAAHELKTPLAILQGELERTLQEVETGSVLQQRLSQLLDEVRRLGSIVRKLLLLSLADAGQMRLHRVNVNLSQILLDLVEDIEILAPEMTVQTQIPSGLKVKADQELLIQVLQNLITNAIKYNLPQGWIRVEVAQQQQVIAVTIRNSSTGIPTEERDRIFDRFHRGDPARTRHIEGFGLGLNLSREIIRAHGGNLVLDETPADQTAFTVILPA